MKEPYQVVDLFAGPGGLAEGFSSVPSENGRPFEVTLSVEMEASAHRTLTLRAFTRRFPRGELPELYYQFLSGERTLEDLEKAYPQYWNDARSEALRLELGSVEAKKILTPRIDRIRNDSGGRTILIGGPPCQAYSLVGRSRNAGNQDYVPEDDGRHFLYREYIQILDRLRPAAFVMENVKGILSSSVAGAQIFERILEDLGKVGHEQGGYRLVALAAPSGSSLETLQPPSARDFVVRAEEFGVPQARHRVFVVGLRSDIAAEMRVPVDAPLLSPSKPVTVRDVLGGMPEVRSGMSREDDEKAWRHTVSSAASELIQLAGQRGQDATLRSLRPSLRAIKAQVSKANRKLGRSARDYSLGKIANGHSGPLQDFLADDRLMSLAQHETRGHMKSDLARYLFCSVFAEVHGRTPKSADFPVQLAPDHRSWNSGKFADRFRVQMWDRASTTVTSHISKDGHYFIHPDPTQCRSLTVREAARLQTFPDNYLFLGNRTQQYIQVGNAVPPFLAAQIAEALLRILP
ncbi:DNA (cytosine-5-)-methyltransferase [Ruegeria sp. HKCCD4884]|uniref:DNA cytosine methyltransferase n=1 Tax=Ruegeria sp. HKCCD4884 TaxID=2683022 RepID=UPI0014919247|nr:DNA cytosine methyltransferase [Ruegeria sp. HKCCD4884]NOD92511.1 DNA (cytosine-5-)-methyltransferase [Ruegeria sp. HKCCD4884]